jgi:hypothetical protein
MCGRFSFTRSPRALGRAPRRTVPHAHRRRIATLQRCAQPARPWPAQRWHPRGRDAPLRGRPRLRSRSRRAAEPADQRGSSRPLSRRRSAGCSHAGAPSSSPTASLSGARRTAMERARCRTTCGCATVAVLWDRTRGEALVESTVLITTAANALRAPVRSRMPAVLPRDATRISVRRARAVRAGCWSYSSRRTPRCWRRSRCPCGCTGLATISRTSSSRSRLLGAFGLDRASGWRHVRLTSR